MTNTPVPPISYPSELPISARTDDLAEAIHGHQVVIVAGETGSGKSTQLPKLCLDLGRGTDGLIGHTQPRRIAARSVAERVAAELGGQVGDLVGYTVRFTDEVGPRTRIKLMTDGVLLAELQHDRELRRYDTVIIDEAHERSLNIDFLLGYLRRLLPRRPDLKVLITSATIDTERFSRHFGDAPVVTVSGRTYPVEVRYRPLDDAVDDDEPRDQPAAICDAVEELFTETDGDVLVFCSGEREIRDAVDALGDLGLPATEIVPLYARLSAADQHRVFEPHGGRRVVVATNVAETSVTVPGIRSVVDPGTARISRYNRRTKVQRLPIEDISRASADQRAGRCGRLGPGICVRLYSEESYESRPAFTEPEIARTNLASVILQMAALGLGDIEGFPFVDPPDRRNIRDGIGLLEELGAVHPHRPRRKGWLTPVGRTLARLPLDPRLGRMLVAADEAGCLDHVRVIAAALAIQDPRDRPEPDRRAADEMHARFIEPDSDFLTFWNLWQYLRDERRSGSSSRFRRLCRREYLNYARVREWQDVHAQLRRITRDLGMGASRDGDPDPDAVHRAILSGLVTQVGRREDDTYDYRGPRGIRFAIAPGSALFEKAPRWLMAAELSETNRLWARTVGRVRPEWIEMAAPHLVTRSYSDAEWDRAQGTAVARESVSLHGLPLVSGRPIRWSDVDPDDARDLFIRHALLANDWDHAHGFMTRNLDRVGELHRLEAKARRTDLMVDEEALVDWFAARLPDHIASGRDFDAWWKRAAKDTPGLLDLALEDLLDPAAEIPDPGQFPEQWHHGDLTLSVSYEFDPNSPTDGMTVEIPARALHRVGRDTFDWLVPGLRRELVTSLVRTMPKRHRRPFAPLPETIDDLLGALDPSHGPVIDVLRRRLCELGGTEIPPGALNLDDLPIHLRPNYRIVDDDGVPIAVGGDLSALRELLASRLRAALASSTHPLERDGLTDWTFGDLPRRVTTTGAGHEAVAYPSLVDEGGSVAIRLLASPEEQHQAMWIGTRRLLLLNRPGLSRTLRDLLTDEVKLALVHGPYASPAEWFEDLLACAVDAVMAEAGGPVWDEQAWVGLRDRVQRALPERVANLGRTAAALLHQHRRLERLLAGPHAEKLQPSIRDIRYQLDALVYPGFLTGLTAAHLADVARYLTAMQWRLDRLGEYLRRDRETMARVHGLEHHHQRLQELLGHTPELEELTWKLQELRVSLFAQPVGAKGQVSEQRIRRALHAIDSGAVERSQ